MKKLFAEFIGSFTLILFGCGSAVLAGPAIGYIGIAFAFGFSFLAMSYAVGHISGGHFNPVVTIGLWTAKRFPWRGVFPYILFQVTGACLASGIIYLIATSTVLPIEIEGFAANSFSKYTILGAFLTEAVLSFVFLIVFIGSTSKDAPANFAPLAVGFCLTCIYLFSIPITNASINPARSTSQAIFSQDPLALPQLWIFWAAPIAGAIIAGLVWRIFNQENGQKVTAEIKATNPVKTAKKPSTKRK